MRKGISFVLVMALVLAGSVTAFAAPAAEVSVPKDVMGTPYEATVKALIEQKIISGYEDGTFRPENSINRAESCSIVVNTTKVSDSAITGAKDSGFTDMKDFAWADKYVNYAVAQGMVSGYGDKIFKPAANVTYGEMATMLVNALGYKASELTGTWPANYLAKAEAVGIFKNLVMPKDQSGKDVTIKALGEMNATRGNVAVMTYAVADKIKEASSKPPVKDPVVPTKPAVTVDQEYSKLAGKLATYSGRAYGMITGTAQIVNAAGDSVEQLEFQLGKATLYVNTDGKVTIPTKAAYLEKGTLYCLKMTDGIVKGISQNKEFGAKEFSEISTSSAITGANGKFEEVGSRANTMVKLTGGAVSFNVTKEASIYVAEFDGNKISGYTAGSLRDIEAGAKVRAYDVSDDTNTMADVVVIVKKDDASKI